jgi:outer membrane protein
MGKIGVYPIARISGPDGSRFYPYREYFNNREEGIVKKILISFVILSFIAIGNTYGARLTKIGFVDVEEVFNSYPGTADVRQKLIDERNKYQENIDKKKEEIANLEKDYELNSPSLSDDERQRRQAEMEYKKEMLSEYIDDTNKKLNALRDELTKPLYQKISTVIQKVSAEKGFSFVFRKGSDILLFQDKEFDLTKDIILRLQKELTIQDR